jgi:hypothetical protein
VAAGEAEGGALVLVEGAAFGPDGFDVGRAAEQAIGEHAHQGAQRVTAVLGISRVIEEP